MDERFMTSVVALGLLCALWAPCCSAQVDDVTSVDDYGNQQTTDTPGAGVQDADEPADSTETLEKGENLCLSAPDPGPCSAELVRYFYDAKSHRCRQFIFGGCQGNGNRFATESECMEACEMTTKPKPMPMPSEMDVMSSSMTYTPPISATSAFDSSMLTLANGNGETSFTFSSEYPFIQLKATDISNFKLRQMREILFEFRSPEAQGLLVYHTLRNPPPEEPKYELYVLLEGGELKTVHVFGANETTLLVGKGLNRDRWHTVSILVNPSLATLQVRVDDETQSIQLEGLDKDFEYDKRGHINSTIFFGGMNWIQDEIESSYLFEHFVGCLRNVQLKSGPVLQVIRPLLSTTHRDIVQGCVDKCQSGENKCRNGGQCINRYDSTTCDCFGTKYEGDSCDYDSPTTITLRGYSYISYRIYDWKDRAHTEYNRISILFRALMGDSILFYAGGTFPYTNHVAVTLLANGSLYVEVDFGSGPHGVHLGEELTMGVWNNFTLIHNGSVLDFLLNGRGPRLNVHSPRHYLRFDPHIFIGGDRKPLGLGLRSSNNFVGCLSEVYFNDVSILHKLRVNAPQALYHSIFRPEIGACKDVPVVPITFPFRESKMSIDFSSIPVAKKFNLKFDFKTRNVSAVLAHGTGETDGGTAGLWELRLSKGEMEFRIFQDVTNETVSLLVLKEGQRLADGSWHQVHFIYGANDVSLAVDYRRPSFVSLSRIGAPSLKLGPNSQVTIGISYFDSMPGFVGCVRDLVINQKKFDPRVLLYTANVREISLDNCQLVDPCHRPNACEHGGLCMVEEGRVVCDCTGTGYTGKNCHFALYKRTCEELALLGYMKSGVYEIDIDGNGPHPPAHVRCEFEAQIQSRRKTVVEHNLPRDVEIRSRNIGDVVFNLTYREFSAEMLQSLISQSLNCSQSIRYDCYRAPLELHSYTWFRSSSGNLLDYLGKAQPGRCPCSNNQTCEQSSVFCNCDADEPRWLSDEGFLTKPHELGITQIYALQQRELVPQGEGRITLGPLECVEANTQQYVVTFKSPDSYMEVPGWHRGDLAFSFRTSSEKAILLYQPLLHPKHPYFRVLLVDDHKLTLEFSINGEPRSVTVKSSRDLNSGEWQQVWIDYNEYHVRFTVNQESILVDLNDGEEFGPFEATLFVGGAPEEMLGSEAVIHSEGLVGCFRGLVMNNEVVNLYAYMNARFPDMIQKHCRPSCDPNPCQNGASCIEYWGSYKCICENPLAHYGYNCETDINRNALTFRTASAFVEANATALAVASHLGLRGFFTEDILINIRTFDKTSLVFYAYDYLNNFVQLRVEDAKRVVFTFNSNNTIYDVSTTVDGLATGKSIQILIDRGPDSTTLFVNGVNNTIDVPLRLLERYARDPWTNKHKELVKPPRPVRRPEEFYQVFLGGVDTDYMTTRIQGYTGCLRGLSIGNKVIALNTNGADGLAIVIEDTGVLHNCNMLCDQHPCQNGGACLEDFRLRNYKCDCELTSYSGMSCTDERGAHFRGDSYITAEYTSVDLNAVKIKMAFSTTAIRNTAQALLLIQTSRDKTKYVLVSLTALGHLRIEDDRGMGIVYGAEVKTINFQNGARHSLYYKRNGDDAVLLVDREEVPVRVLSASIHSDGLVDVTDEDGIHIGGVKSTNDPRFTGYDHFDGCMSNVVVELDGVELHPILSYLGYHSGLKGHQVQSHDPEGIEEEARCSAFSINPPGVIEDDMDYDNDTSDQDWMPKPPLVLPYKPIFVGPPKYDSSASNRMLVGLGCLFLAGTIALIIYVCKTHRRSRKRKYMVEDEQMLITRAPKTAQNVRPALRNANRSVGVSTSRPVAKEADGTLRRNGGSSGGGLERLLLAPPPSGASSSGKQMVIDLLDSLESQRCGEMSGQATVLPPLTPLLAHENVTPPYGTNLVMEFADSSIVDSRIDEVDENEPDEPEERQCLIEIDSPSFHEENETRELVGIVEEAADSELQAEAPRREAEELTGALETVDERPEETLNDIAAHADQNVRLSAEQQPPPPVESESTATLVEALADSVQKIADRLIDSIESQRAAASECTDELNHLLNIVPDSTSAGDVALSKVVIHSGDVIDSAESTGAVETDNRAQEAELAPSDKLRVEESTVRSTEEEVPIQQRDGCPQSTASVATDGNPAQSEQELEAMSADSGHPAPLLTSTEVDEITEPAGISDPDESITLGADEQLPPPPTDDNEQGKEPADEHGEVADPVDDVTAPVDEVEKENKSAGTNQGLDEWIVVDSSDVRQVPVVEDVATDSDVASPEPVQILDQGTDQVVDKTAVENRRQSQVADALEEPEGKDTADKPEALVVEDVNKSETAQTTADEPVESPAAEVVDERKVSPKDKLQDILDNFNVAIEAVVEEVVEEQVEPLHEHLAANEVVAAVVLDPVDRIDGDEQPAYLCANEAVDEPSEVSAERAGQFRRAAGTDESANSAPAEQSDAVDEHSTPEGEPADSAETSEVSADIAPEDAGIVEEHLPKCAEGVDMETSDEQDYETTEITESEVVSVDDTAGDPATEPETGKVAGLEQEELRVLDPAGQTPSEQTTEPEMLMNDNCIAEAGVAGDENAAQSESGALSSPSAELDTAADVVESVGINGGVNGTIESSIPQANPQDLSSTLGNQVEEVVDNEPHVKDNAEIDGQNENPSVQYTNERRAPLGRISEVFLSDDERCDPFVQDLDLVFEGGSSDLMSNPGENDDLQSAAPITATAEDQNHGQTIFSTVDQVKLQRSVSDSGIAVPGPIYLADTVRTYANPLSYLGGPRLQTANLQQTSKESVLSIDE